MDEVNDSNNQKIQGVVQPQSTPVYPFSPKPKSGEIIPPWVSSTSAVDEGTLPPPSGYNGEPKSTPPVAIKKSPFFWLIPFLGLVLFGGLVYLLVTKLALPLLNKMKAGETTPVAEKAVTLNYWGLWETEKIIQPLIDEYQTTHPQVIIKYTQQSYKDYRERLQSALAKLEGPDIFRFHISWMPMLKKELFPAPDSIGQQINLTDNYFPYVGEKLKLANQTLGVPLGFDTLLLYYNQQLFKEANKTFPTTWEELRRTAKDICVAEGTSKQCQPGGKIKIAGVALGTASNVDHFSDILGLMMLQNGVDFTKPSSVLAEDVLKFYTLFVTTDGVWDETLPVSVYAFAQGKVAMMIAPSWRAHDILQINPTLDFKMVPVPQLPGTQISWATFWVEGVANQSKNTAAAWEFLQYLSTKESLTKFYTEASKERKFGEPYPRKDLASTLENDPWINAVIKQAPLAKSWYLCSNTHDNGINDKIIKYYTDAVNAMLKGQTATQALSPLALGVNQVLVQYGLATPPSSPQ